MLDNLGFSGRNLVVESFPLHLELLTHLSLFQWHQKLTPEHNPQLEAGSPRPTVPWLLPFRLFALLKSIYQNRVCLRLKLQ